jgi:hypothetical protein
MNDGVVIVQNAHSRTQTVHLPYYTQELRRDFARRVKAAFGHRCVARLVDVRGNMVYESRKTCPMQTFMPPMSRGAVLLATFDDNCREEWARDKVKDKNDVLETLWWPRMSLAIPPLI